MLKRIPFLLLLLVQSVWLTFDAAAFLGAIETTEISGFIEEGTEEESRENEKFEENKHKKAFDNFDDAELSESNRILFARIEHCAYKTYISTHVQFKFRLYLLFHQLKSEL